MSDLAQVALISPDSRRLTRIGLAAGSTLPALFVPTETAARRFWEFFTVNIGVPTPNVKNRTLRNSDHSFETAKGRRGLKEPLRRRPAACQV